MSSKVQKWGNSFGIRIPKAIMEKLNLQENAEVQIEHKDGKIIVFPVQPKITLESLVGGITKANLHSEENYRPEGGEQW